MATKKTPDVFIKGITSHAGEQIILKALQKENEKDFEFLLENEEFLNGELTIYFNKADKAQRDAYFPELKTAVGKRRESTVPAEVSPAVSKEVLKPAPAKNESPEKKMLLTAIRAEISALIGGNKGGGFYQSIEKHFTEEMKDTVKIYFPLFDVAGTGEQIIMLSIRAAFTTVIGKLPEQSKEGVSEEEIAYSIPLGMLYGKKLLAGFSGNTEEGLKEIILTSVATKFSALTEEPVADVKARLMPYYASAMEEFKEESFSNS